MKIIKQGKLPINTETFICKTCGCIFEALKGEYTKGQQKNEFYVSSYCPCCGKWTAKEKGVNNNE